MTEEEKEMDQRWCELGDDRYGEYGVIGAEQADESYMDDRLTRDEEEDDDQDDFGADGRIHFSKEKLYGREEELDQCRELFEANEASAVFVAGYSGSGKSRMVEEFVNRNSSITDDRKPSIVFLRSKSDAMQASLPFSSIKGLFDNIDRSVSVEFIDMRDEIQETLGSDAQLLLKVFPKLEKYIQKDAEDTNSLRSSASSKSDSLSDTSSAVAAVSTGKKQDTKRRMMVALQVFFRTMSRRSNRRLCLFVDDLQWADSLTMELIECILTDNTIRNLFFFGVYRSNEVDDAHVLMKTMQIIKERRKEMEMQACLHIELGELDKDAIGQFIADSLRLSFEEALPLTNAVFSKTLGNPFFTRQALEYLVLKNALYYDNISFRWDWKLREKELQDLISDDLLEMIKVKIEHLEPQLQEVLMTASYTRSTFEVETVLVLLRPKFLKQNQAVSGTDASEEEYGEEKRRLIGLLNEAVMEGLLVRPQEVNRTSNLRYSIVHAKFEEYAFAHDKIQETAKRLISSFGDEFEFLERIGNTLSHMAEASLFGEDWMYFTACEHLNRVSTQYRTKVEAENQKPNLIDSEKQFRLATLNLRTAELSMDLMAFPAAIEFCEHGLAYLPAAEEERWSEKFHDTTLKFYSIAAQAKYGVSDIEEAERYCNLVISQRSGYKPKVTTVEAIPVFLIYLDIVGEKGQKEAGLELCLEILREFGISAPRNERMLRAKVWWTLKQVKSQYLPTKESIQNMPHVTDLIAAEKMELMKSASSLAFSADAKYLYMLLSCESVKCISEHGLAESSAASIASFANVLMHVYNDFETSPKLAELAIFIADRQQKKFSETQPLNTATNNVLAWVRPISSCLKYHERAYNSGMYVTLSELEGEFRAGDAEMRRTGQHFMANFASIVWQLTLNLIGKSGNPNTTVLTGEAIDESTELYQKKIPHKVVFGAWKSFALLFFGDFEAGAEDAITRGEEFPKFAVGMMFGFETVMRAIPLLITARSDNPHKGKYRKEATILLKRVRQWVKNGCVNLVGVHQLMEAEYMALKKNASAARSYFEMAITSCRKDGFHHFAGLSCELYSGYLSETGDSKGEKIYLQGAIDDYRRWGSARKVDLLKKKLVV